MSEEMAVVENNDASNNDEPQVNGDTEEKPCETGDTLDNPGETSAPVPESTETQDQSDDVPNAQEDDTKRGQKRRASAVHSDENEEFRGFDPSEIKDTSEEYTKIIERLEMEISSKLEGFTPLTQVTATLNAALRSTKRMKPETDGSRPSSALSMRSDGDGIASSDRASSATSSPTGRRRATTTELSSPLLRAPLEKGWRRELVYRAALDTHSKRNADVYYYTPQGKKLRSSREISEYLSGTGFTLENFSFFKEALGVDDPEKEIIRDAKMIRRLDSPQSTPAPVPIEGKRTPKPKAPKGASPERPNFAAAKIKVKSVGSRLSSSNTSSTTPTTMTVKNLKKANATPTDNNNSASWKKTSEDRRRRTANGAASPPHVPQTPPTPLGKRRGRPKLDDTDHFTRFYNTSQKNKGVYDVVVQIFQYVGMRELAQCARVCRLWRELVATPSLWRHVRMKNSQVSDWGGLCSALKRHGTVRLDLRKMLLPHSDTEFWKQFAQHISTVDTLERIEMCRCPSSAVEAVCKGLPHLKALSAVAVRDPHMDPAPLATLTGLQELRLKSMAGLTLTSDLKPLANLNNLQHLSLTSIKELGSCECEVVGSLKQLISLELGECTFGAEFGATLARLQRLQRLRLERGTAECAAPALLRALATLPKLLQLELVNFDVKVGFDDALAECRNVQRLLIIPTYVSQSATTNKQVLSGVLRLKDSLTHLMWGVTIELLRVTELFIDQCEQGIDKRKGDIGECIPVLKPVPGCRLPDEHPPVAGPPQVEILPLTTLQKLLSAQLPNTKLKILRIPFHATWRQSLADFQ